MALPGGETVAPVIGGVQITGTPSVGGTLSGVATTVTGYPTPTLTYQWVSRVPTFQSWGTATTLLVNPDMQGLTIDLVITATNPAGTAQASASVSIPISTGLEQVVGVAATPPTPPPTITPPPTTATTTTGGVTPGSPTDVQALLELGNTANGFESTPTGRNVSDAWDYLRTQVEDVFSGIEHSLEDVSVSSLAGGTDVAFVEVGAEAALVIEDLPAVAFAGALLLGEYIFGWIVKKVAALFPNPSVLGWHPLGFIKSGLNSIGQALDNNAAYFVHKVSPVFITPIRQILGVFQRLGNAVVGAHNKSATIVNNNLPQARHDAVVTSQQYTDQLKAEIQVAASQAAAVLSLPISEDQAKWLLGQAAKNGGLAWELVALAATAIIASDQYANQLHTNSAQQIDTKATEIQQQQAQALKDFQASVLARLSVDETTLAGIQTTVTTAVPPEVTTAINDAVSAENTKVQSQIGSLTTTLNSLTTQQASLTDQLTKAQATLASLQTQLNAELSASPVDQTTITQIQSDISTVQTEITTLTTAISTLHSQILATGSQITQIQQAQQLNTSQLAPYEVPGAITLPVILATLTAGLSALKTKVDTCVVQTCDPSSPTHIKNVLKDLLGALTAAGEIGFLAEAIKNPIGTANTLAPFLDGIDQAAVSTLDALLSL